MIDLLKPKETPKITPETIEKAPSPVEAAPAPKVEIKEPQREQPREQQAKQPQHAQLPSVSQHVQPLTQRVPTPATKSERLIDIEKIMSEGLEEIFVSLPPEVQATVKLEGEKAATQIEKLVESGKEISKKVLSVLRGWLNKIPGVNKFFLEQESKRKTDRIMAMARKSKGG